MGCQDNGKQYLEREMYKWAPSLSTKHTHKSSSKQSGNVQPHTHTHAHTEVQAREIVYYERAESKAPRMLMSITHTHK